MALSDLLGRNSAQAAVMPSGGALGGTHFAQKAKRVIYLFQSGGPSHLDLFDDKPTLADMHGTDMPATVLGTQRVLMMTRGYNVGTGCSRSACPVAISAGYLDVAARTRAPGSDLGQGLL